MEKKGSAKCVYEESEIREFKEYVSKHFGSISKVIKDDEPSAINCDILVIEPTEDFDYYTLVTCGAGAYRMDIPDEFKDLELEYAEYAIRLPAYFDIDSGESEFTWPVTLLRNVARYPSMCNIWLSYRQSICFFKDGGSFDKSVKFTSVLLVNSKEAGLTDEGYVESEGKRTNIYAVYPLFPEELKYLEKKSYEELIERIISSDEGFPVVNFQRESSVLKKERTMKNTVLQLLESGKSKRISGEFEEAANELREAVDEAVKLKDKDLMYKARIELANTYLDFGDLIEFAKVSEEIANMKGKKSELIEADISLMSGRFFEYKRMWEKAAMSYSLAAEKYTFLVDEDKDYPDDEISFASFRTILLTAYAWEEAGDYKSMTDFFEIAKGLYAKEMEEAGDEGIFLASMYFFLYGEIYACAEHFEEAEKAQKAANDKLIELFDDEKPFVLEYLREFVRQYRKRAVMYIQWGKDDDANAIIDEADALLEDMKSMGSLHEEIALAENALLRAISSQKGDLKAKCYIQFRELANKHPELSFLSKRAEEIKSIISD